jgi:hypothetical protein
LAKGANRDQQKNKKDPVLHKGKIKNRWQAFSLPQKPVEKWLYLHINRMKPRNVLLTLLVILAILALAINSWRHEYRAREAFNRQPGKVYFTHHALCRMDCRHISKKDIAEIMEKGVIMLNKSNRSARPCPMYAMQGRTTGGERLRVIFAQCREETRVVTCYNLDEEFECHCPGDENKNQR